jgi:hypothetical protein
VVGIIGVKKKLVRPVSTSVRQGVVSLWVRGTVCRSRPPREPSIPPASVRATTIPSMSNVKPFRKKCIRLGPAVVGASSRPVFRHLPDFNSLLPLERRDLGYATFRQQLLSVGEYAFLQHTKSLRYKCCGRPISSRASGCPAARLRLGRRIRKCKPFERYRQCTCW